MKAVPGTGAAFFVRVNIKIIPIHYYFVDDGFEINTVSSVYSSLPSIDKNENPLSTYHHPSETPCSSHLQSGDRLLLTYHPIYHLSPSDIGQSLHINISLPVNRSFNKG